MPSLAGRATSLTRYNPWRGSLNAQNGADMFRSRSRTVAIYLSCLLSTGGSYCLRADEPKFFKALAGLDAAELKKLTADYERLSQLRHEAIKATPEGLIGGGAPSDEKLSTKNGSRPVAKLARSNGQAQLSARWCHWL